jgi:transposase-like protein
VFGGVERGTGRLFMVPVEKRDKETLLAVIKHWILPGSTIYSDSWKAYDCLGKEGFEHLKVNHKVS